MRRENLGERVAALETDVPHLWKKLDLTTDGLKAISEELAQFRSQFRETVQLLRSYGRAALLMAAAGLLHATAQPAAKIAASGLHMFLKAIGKLPI